MRAALLALALSATGSTGWASTTTRKNPLDQVITVKIASGSLRDVFDAVSVQTELHFNLVGLDQCTIGAFLWNLPTRYVLQALLETGGFTYQRLGRSDTYTVFPRALKRPMCSHSKPIQRGSGECVIEKDAPIAVECKDAPLHSFARSVFSQSEGNFVMWDGAEQYPVTGRFEAAALDSVMASISADTALSVKQFGEKRVYLIRRAQETL